MADDTTTTASTAGDAGSSALNQAVGMGAGTVPATQPQVDRTFTQAEVDDLIKNRLARESEKARQQAEKARAEAEQKALAEQGEFKALAEKRAADLEAMQSRVKSLAVKAEAAALVQKLGITKPVDKVLRLVDQGRVEFDGDGQPTNLEDLLKEVIKDWPELLGQAQGMPSTGAAPHNIDRQTPTSNQMPAGFIPSLADVFAARK